MTVSVKILWAATLLLSACTTSDQAGGPAPLTESLYSEFKASDAAPSQYGPFLAATLAQHDEESAKAASYYLEALNADPGSNFVADRAFHQLMYSGRISDAVKIAARMMADKSADADDLVRLTYVLDAYGHENWPEVRQRLVLAKDTGFGFLFMPILGAWSYAAEGNGLQAEEALAPLLMDPRFKSIAAEHQAYILDYLGQYDRAAHAYQALTGTPGQPPSIQLLVAYAHMLYRTGQQDTVRAFLGEKTKQFGDNRYLLREGMRIMGGQLPTQQSATPAGAASAVFNRFANELAQGRATQAAVIYLRLATYLTPDVAENHYMMGNLLEQSGTPDAAVVAYSAVPPESPLYPFAELRRVEALKSAGRTGEAEDQIRSVLRANPDDPVLLTMLADMLRERKQHAEAVARYTQAIDQVKRPTAEDWFRYFARGVSYEQMGDWPSAERDMLHALTLNPGEATVLNYLGYSWVERGKNLDDAKKLISKAVEASPDDGFIIDSYGWVHYLTGNYGEAVDLLERAVRLEPNDPTINDHLGDAYWRVGRRFEARFQWRHALDGKPEADERQAIRDKIDLGLPGQS